MEVPHEVGLAVVRENPWGPHPRWPPTILRFTYPTWSAVSDLTIAEFVREHNRMLKGYNGTRGLNTRVDMLEEKIEPAATMIEEWKDLKSQLKGMKRLALFLGAVGVVGVGGGFWAILRAIGQLAAALP